MDWDDLRHFLALARTGSVRAAGAALGVSHSTVARRVESLETQLGTRLFDRTPGGVSLTEAGHQMLPGATRVEQELAQMERGLVGQDGRLEGVVSITCCDVYVSDLLVQGLAPFCRQFPEIELHMTTDSRLFDLSKREADIAVRIVGQGSEPPAHLIGRKLVPVVVANYVAQDHAPRLDPDIPGSEPRWVAFEGRKLVERLVAATSYPQVPPWGAFASLPLLVQATQAGMGIAMLPTYVGDTATGLRRLAQPDLLHVADIWLLSHVDLRDNARFRAARRTVAASLTEARDLFEGNTCPENASLGPKNAPGETADPPVG